MRLLIFIFLLILAAPQSKAACTCQCVNGQMRPLCSSPFEIPPICPPTMCGIVPPMVQPIQPPTLPPLGTQSCRMVQVQNPWGGFEWRQICR
jgi:hypothetical protein